MLRNRLQIVGTVLRSLSNEVKAALARSFARSALPAVSCSAVERSARRASPPDRFEERRSSKQRLSP
jgi:hypothetical protein